MGCFGKPKPNSSTSSSPKKEDEGRTGGRERLLDKTLCFLGVTGLKESDSKKSETYEPNNVAAASGEERSLLDDLSLEK